MCRAFHLAVAQGTRPPHSELPLPSLCYKVLEAIVVCLAVWNGCGGDLIGSCVKYFGIMPLDYCHGGYEVVIVPLVAPGGHE